MEGFVLNGYNDLETLTEDAYAVGSLRADSEAQQKGVVAWILKCLLERIPEVSQEQRAMELLLAVSGMVDCAERDNLI
jgi:hypothetical protein